MAEKRRKFPSEEKVRILRRHLLEKVPLSDLCDEYGLHPTVFYRWQKTLFEKGAAAFENHGDARSGCGRISVAEFSQPATAPLQPVRVRRRYPPDDAV